MDKGLDQDIESTLEDINDTKMDFGDKVYSWKDLSLLIAEHNKKLDMPGLNELSVEKQKIIDWRDYNTPSLKNVLTTPMVGTMFEKLERSNPLFIYNEWVIASHYLLKEYGIWIKVKLFLENGSLNNSLYNSIEYKQAYHYFLKRQFNIYGIGVFKKKNYAVDYTLYENIYRELSEDLLYILLNLLLANEIIGNINLEESLKNKDSFNLILTSIIKNHYDEYNDAYKSLEYLKWSSCSYNLSKPQIVSLYEHIKNNP
jgi:hypothetical protein